MRIAMLTMEKYDNRKPDSVGSSRIRGRWVMKYAPQIEDFRNGQKYDAVIYQKAYYKKHMEQFKGVKIFDICDPDWMEGRPIAEVCELVDAITVPTQPLADFIKQVTDKPVVVIPDRIDPEDHTPVKAKHQGRARSVVWFGYSQNQVVLDQTIVPLHNMGLSLVVISERPYHDADKNISFKYSTLYEELIKHDIVLMPDFKRDRRHAFKSNNKTLTAWAIKMPVATSPEELERFLDPEERAKEAETRYKEVMGMYHARQSGPEYIKLIEQIVKNKGGE